MNTSSKLWAPLCVLLLFGVHGCATVALDESDEIDPLESWNRDVDDFNDALDRKVLKPTADAYVKVTSRPVRNSVSNFFDNIRYLNVILNDLLQGKIVQGLSDTGRFAVNTTLGVAGLFDVATGLGLEQHNEDFGQTLAVWGWKQSGYIVWPLLGPYTFRDSFGIPVDYLTNLSHYLWGRNVTMPLFAVNIVDARVRASGAIRFRDTAALDPYLFTREAYLQHREFLIYDGNPPPPKFFELDDEFPEGEKPPSQ
jgi:phospholipid-binding lipoprotein MlaA